MMWSRILPWLFGRGKKAPLRRSPSLAVEVLEDRLVPSTFYDAWRQQTFHVDDVQVGSLRSALAIQAATPTNASFGSMIGLPSAFTNTPYRGQGYSVAVLDTGIDYTNAALGGGFGAGKRVVAGWDFVNNDADPMDDHGHGTHVAGIVGSADATYSGVAPNVNFIALKVLDSAGSGTFGNVEKALQWVAANRAAYNIVAVNLSLGSGNYTSNPYTFLDDEFSTLKNIGVFLSVAAGNTFYSYASAPGLDYPAVSPLVVSVGAVYNGNFGSVAWGSGARDYTTAVDRVASFSQRSSALSIMAPGAMITSTYLGGKFQAMAGTSMAAPVIAGASVLIHQAMDALGQTANQTTILSLMKSTGVNVVDGDDENDNVTNTGLTFKRIDVGAALSSLGKPSNYAPVLQPIAAHSLAPASSLQVTLNASDANGDAITYSASVLNASAGLAYQLKLQLGLTYPGSYYQGYSGQNEKWMIGSGDNWYCILPNGELRKWAGTMSATLQAANLIATFSTSYYNDPSLLWNAQPAGAAPTLSVAGNVLTVQAPADSSGTFSIQVTASDGSLSSSQTFTVTIKNNTAPQLGAVPAQSLLTNRSQAITISAIDAQNDAITLSAAIVGTFSTAPASITLVGKTLTINTSPDFVGEFDIRVTASDGSLSSSTLIHVTLTAASIGSRHSADFNGDGIKDTAFHNADGSWWVSLNKADGSFVNQKWAHWSAPSAWSLIQTGDFNGDGRADVIGHYSDGSWWVGLSTGASFTAQFWAQWAAPSAWGLIRTGDFNGDGRTDIIGFYNDGSWWVGLSTGSGFRAQFWSQWDAPKYWSLAQVGDFNGDGRTDISAFAANGTWWVGLSTGAGFAVSLWATWAPAANWSYVQVGDFNGDGKSDIVGFNTAGTITVGASTGKSFDSKIWTQWTAASNWTSFGIADLNADRRLDFFARAADGSWQVAYSTGSAFNTQPWNASTAPGAK